jgi:phospholipid/cholesterol/gamma-HCH transport system substrate-binding protein
VNSPAQKRRVNDALVGASVLGVLTVLTAAILWLNQSSMGDRRDKVFVRTRDVGGVSLGSPVVMRGVKSGRVDQVALGDNGWVVARLALDAGVTLPSDPVVLLQSSSLFGEWQATLLDGAGVPPDRELRAAIAEARGARDTLPGALLPDIAQLTAVAGRIAGDLAEVADRVRTVFDDSAALELRSTIRSLADLSGELQRTVATQSRNLDVVGRDVQRGVRDLSRAAAVIDSVARRVDASTSRGEIQTIVSTVQQASGELLATARQLRSLSTDVERTQVRLERAVANADSVFAKVNRGDGTMAQLVNDPALYANSDSLMVELRALVRDIRANPRKYFNLRIF